MWRLPRMWVQEANGADGTKRILLWWPTIVLHKATQL